MPHRRLVRQFSSNRDDGKSGSLLLLTVRLKKVCSLSLSTRREMTSDVRRLLLYERRTVPRRLRYKHTIGASLPRDLMTSIPPSLPPGLQARNRRVERG